MSIPNIPLPQSSTGTKSTYEKDPKKRVYAMLQIPTDLSHERTNRIISLQTSSPYVWLKFLTGVK